MADNRYDEALDIVARDHLADDADVCLAIAAKYPIAEPTRIAQRMQAIANRPTREQYLAAHDYLANNPKENRDE